MKYDFEFSKGSSHEKIANLVLENSVVLEFGCSTGIILKYLKEKKNCEVYGIELAQEAFDVAKSFLDGGLCCDVEKLEWTEKFENDKFDYILFPDILEHLRNPEEVLKSAADLLKIDGKVIVSIPNIAHNDVIKKLYYDRFDYTATGLLDETHIHFWGLYNIRDFFLKSGYVLAEVDGLSRPIGTTEQKILVNSDNEDNVDGLLKCRAYGDIYQFICSAYKKDYSKIVDISLQNKITEKSNSFIKIYFDLGSGYSEENIVRIPVNFQNKMIEAEIDVPNGAKILRIDPVEGQYCFAERIKFRSDNGNVDYFTNGYKLENYDVFLTKDPQIIVPINKPISKILMTLTVYFYADKQLFALFSELRDFENALENAHLNVSEKESIIASKSLLISEIEENVATQNKIIAEKDEIIVEKNEIISEKDEIIAEKEAQLIHYKTHYNAMAAQRNQLQDELDISNHKFNTINNAFFWKITKPFRVITDGMKFCAKKFPLTRNLYKFLMVWKNLGFKEALKKVGRKGNEKKRLKEINKISEQELESQKNYNFKNNPKISIVVPLYNTPENLLTEMIDSVKNQTYQNWELCLTDGSDEKHNYVEKICKNYEKKDKRIIYKKLEKNLGISENTNAAIDMSTGDYIGLLDHDDLLNVSALYYVVKEINEKDADFIYTDEDKIDEKGKKHSSPYFKSDFSMDALCCINYICHFTVFKRELMDKVGKFRSQFDGAQDHDLFLRLTEKAEKISHIPKILYHWRMIEASTAMVPESKSYTSSAGVDAVQEHLDRCKLKGKVMRHREVPNLYRVSYEIEDNPMISIIIPNKDHIDDLKTCIDSIKELSTYKNYEIIIVENNSENEETFDYYNEISKNGKVNVIYYKGDFNYSAINNFARKSAKGDYLLFLNNDIEIITPNWLEEMLMFCQRSDVGAAGAMLYYPDETIQHAGVILGIGGIAGHSHKYFPRNSYGYFSRLCMQQAYSACTAACLMVKASVFDEINGFDEKFKVAFNDVDLCMRIRALDYLIIWTPYAEAYHHESKSRGYEDTPEKQARFTNEVNRFYMKWDKELKSGDPYYNENLSLISEDFRLKE